MARKKKELPTLENVEIQDFAAEGKCVTRIKWRPDDETPIVLFVPYGAPGDIADIKVRRKKNKYAEGEIVKITKPSELRIVPRCSHFGTCGGCKWQQLSYPSQLKFKGKQVEEVLKRISKVHLPEVKPVIGADDCWEYRNKMEYTFSDKKWRSWEEIKSGEDFSDSSNGLGFHIAGSFDKVLHIEKCHLQANIGNEIRNFIYDYAQEKGLSFYNIKNNHGLLRNMMIRIASTGEIMLVVIFGEELENGFELLKAIEEKFPQITSLGYIINKKLNDSISDQTVVFVKGKEYITEEMEGLHFRVNAKSFYQTNSKQAYNLYKVARDFAGLEEQKNTDGKKPIVYDLYTGAGTIANFVASKAEKVIGIEYVPEAIEDAKLNSAINGIENTVFYAGDMKDILTEEFIADNGHPDIMIIDPPRAGMHPDVVKVILEAEPDVIVYVSCNPATQARDLELLDAKYRVTDVQPVDMFPHTHHIENVCRLERR